MNLRNELEEQDRQSHYAGIQKEYYLKGKDSIKVLKCIREYYPELHITDDVEDILSKGRELQLFLDTGKE